MLFKERDAKFHRAAEEQELNARLNKIVSEMLPAAKKEFIGLSGEEFREAFIKRHENEIIGQIYGYKSEGKRLDGKINKLAKRETKIIDDEPVITDGFNQVEVIRGYLYKILDESLSDQPEITKPTDQETDDFMNTPRETDEIENQPDDGNLSDDLTGVEAGNEDIIDEEKKKVWAKQAKQAEQTVKTLRSQDIRRGVDPNTMDDIGYNLPEKK